jgi:hypothetical protein
MRIKTFKDYRERLWNTKVVRDIDFEKLKQDLDDIVVELKDDPKFVISIDYKYDTVSILIHTKGTWDDNKRGYFNIGSIKDYLDMIVDYIDSYYNYDLEVKILPKNTGSYKEYDNYELHLDKDVYSISLEFFDLKKSE